jgi:hypothetical protein
MYKIQEFCNCKYLHLSYLHILTIFLSLTITFIVLFNFNIHHYHSKKNITWKVQLKSTSMLTTQAPSTSHNWGQEHNLKSIEGILQI